MCGCRCVNCLSLVTRCVLESLCGCRLYSAMSSGRPTPSRQLSTHLQYDIDHGRTESIASRAQSRPGKHGLSSMESTVARGVHFRSPRWPSTNSLSRVRPAPRRRFHASVLVCTLQTFCVSQCHLQPQLPPHPRRNRQEQPQPQPQPPPRLVPCSSSRRHATVVDAAVAVVVVVSHQTRRLWTPSRCALRPL